MQFLRGTSIAKTWKNFKQRLEANSVWENDCQWPERSIEDTKLDWIAAGGFFGGVEYPFKHASAFARLNRDDVANHWAGKLAEAVGNSMVDVPLDLYERWATMEHEGLWRELAPTLTENAWYTVLQGAGGCGNLLPFSLCSRKEVLAYVQSESLPHPKVALWLVQQKYMQRSDLSALVEPYLFDMQGSWFMNCPTHEPVAPEYVAEMCKLMLSEYGLSLEQKIRVVAQATMAFEYRVWAQYIEPACIDYLKGIDLDLVHAICGVEVVDEDGEESLLHMTLRCAAQSPNDDFDPTAQMDPAWFGKQGGSIHEGLALLLNLTPPQNRIELYTLAKTAQDVEMGIVVNAQHFPLPEGL